MKIKFTIAAAILALSASCAGAEPQNQYKLTVNFEPENDGEVVYLFDYDTGEKVDSTLVSGGVALFTGSADTPRMVRIISGGDRFGSVILEKANIDVWAFDGRCESDGELSMRSDAFASEVDKLGQQLRALPDDAASAATADSIYAAYDRMMEQIIAENAGNPLGKYMFMNVASSLDLAGYDEYMAKYPALKEWVRIANLREGLLKRAETSVGRKYKDFEVTYDGTTKRLSDYVGPDHYTIVDFWASWCGPCIRQVKVLKELYSEYADKGLKFLSVAVWDNPENTIEAIKSHEIPWDQIIDAQSIPTDLYGISGIPCIILIAPDGTIVSRDKQSEELKADVAAAMSTFVAPATQE